MPHHRKMAKKPNYNLDWAYKRSREILIKRSRRIRRHEIKYGKEINSFYPRKKTHYYYPNKKKIRGARKKAALFQKRTK